MAITTSTLEATARETSGKGFARRTRLEGKIPAIVYGKHLKAPVSISVDPAAVRAAINTPRKLNTLINLKIGGSSQMVMLKDYQQDPVTRALLHADFIDVRETDQVRVKVPLVLVGKAVGVAEGGILSQQRREIEVYALPSAIPEKIEVDVTALKVAQAMHINDVQMPAGVTNKSHVNFTVAIVAIPEAEVVAVVAAPVAVEGAPAGAAAGAAPGAAPGAAAPAAGDKAAPAAGGKAAPAAAAPKKK
ncbi:MAG: ribosomal protein L25p [Myxococcaceae bacterium]|nr:ribosomal protein L25p [Myxococcaceae bacterium]